MMKTYLGECPERESALHLAHVVLQDVLLGEGLCQVETVFYLETLAHGTLLCTGTHCTRGYTLSIT